jgi:hypothetical protein
MFDIIPDIKPSANMLRCTLSGGEQQMGRGRPRPDGQAAPIVARRASLGLAPVAMQEVFQIIAEIQKRGTTVLLVEQNAHMALNWAMCSRMAGSRRWRPCDALERATHTYCLPQKRTGHGYDLTSRIVSEALMGGGPRARRQRAGKAPGRCLRSSAYGAIRIWAVHEPIAR